MGSEEKSKALNGLGDNPEKEKTKIAWSLLSSRDKKDGSDDVSEAVALLEERVKDMDADAMWMLGVCKDFGIGTEQDSKQAASLYSQSEKGGSDIAGCLVKSVRCRKAVGELFRLQIN